MSFFATDWYLCVSAGPDDRPCTTGSPSRRLLKIEDASDLNDRPFLVITLNGNRVGYGYAREDSRDARNNEIYFMEALATGETYYYSGKVFAYDPASPNVAEVRGKRRKLRLDKSATDKQADDDWTSNRPVAGG